jgi:MFS family permease
MRTVLANRNFQLWFMGQNTSLLGDQFHGIAAPWLVLTLTNDPVALGMVLALGGVPRALLLLLGGAITDRFTPRGIMLTSDILRLVLTACLCFLTWTGAIQLWMLYVFALAFGTISAFFYPASGALLPTFIEKDNLQQANALSQGTMQLVNFLAPALAGTMIAAISAATGDKTRGVALAFGVDSFSFLVSIVTLWWMRIPSVVRAGSAAAEPVLKAIRAGFLFAWEDELLRVFFIIITIINFLFVGPLVVGIPVLANQRLPEGAAALGIIMSGYGGGNLVGIIISGAVKQKRNLNWMSVGLVCSFGVGLALLGLLNNTWLDAALLFVLGIGNGYLAIILITFLQRRTPTEMLGRMMSLVLLSNVGLGPISQAASGAVSNISLEALFIGAGALIFLTGLWSAFQPGLHLMDAEYARLEATQK